MMLVVDITCLARYINEAEHSPSFSAVDASTREKR